MAHLGFKDVLPVVEPVVEATADVDTLAEPMNDTSITETAAPPALPGGAADEDFFNEGAYLSLDELPFSAF